MSEKRPHSPNGHVEPADTFVDGSIVLKKQKLGSEIIVGTVTKEGIKRTSNLQAPIMQLTGHGAEIYSLKFSPDGQALASGSFDRHIFLWKTYEDCPNYMMLKGHRNAVLEVQWTSDGDRILSCSADKTVRAWDARTGDQVKKSTEHDSFVNSVCPMRRGPPLFVSGSDDATIKVWDHRSRRSVVTFREKFQVTAVAFADAGDQVYSGGLDNSIKVWDLRKDDEPAMVLKGHGDTLTGIRVSPDGSHLLSNAMDGTLRMWDMRPYAPQNRCVKTFMGHQHTFERLLLRCDWSADGQQVTAGSSDRSVYIWDVSTRKLLYKLPGHNGSVNEAVFHPKEPIIGSCSSDKTIFLGELMV
jgi:Prp8 binding protein